MGNLTVEVTDGTNAVEGATVSLTETLTGTTDANGEVTIEDVDGGDYTLSVTATGYADYTQSVSIDGDTDVDVTLTPVDTLTITVDNGDDPAVAIEGASIVIGETTKTTTANGEAEFTNIPYDDYTATISADGYTTATEELQFRSNHKSFTVSLTSAQIFKLSIHYLFFIEQVV